MMMHTEEQLTTSPLQFYRRAFWVALAITIMLAATLSLHLYNLKLQHTFTQLEAHYGRLNSQLDKTITAIDNIFLAVDVSLEQPLSYEFPQPKVSPVVQHSNYFYQSLGKHFGELVGYGDLDGIDLTHPYWQRVMALGGVFNTSLALLEPLEAIAYVSDSGLVFVKRRHNQQSELLSKIVSGSFKANPDPSKYMVSQRIEVANKSYFALSSQRTSSSRAHTLMIFDATKFQALFYDKSLPKAEIYLNDKLHRNVISALSLGKPAYSEQSEIAPWHEGVTFYKSDESRPLDVVMKVSEKEFAETIIYSLGLEFSFILLFILATYFPLHWLCEQIFVRPLKELFSFIQQPDNISNNYIVPKLWLAEFKQVKAILQRRAHLFSRVKEDHLALTEQLHQKQQFLELVGQDKERQSAILKGVLDAVPDAIYFKNTDGMIVGCNRAFECLIKTSKQHALGKDFHDFAAHLNCLKGIEAKVREQHKPISQKVMVEANTYFTTIVPFFSEQLGIMGCVGVLRDITEHQTALHLLQVSESKFKSAIEYAPNGIALVKVDGTVMMLNKAAERYLGCENKQGEHVSTLFGYENYQQLSQLLEHLSNHNQSVDQLSLTQSGTYSFLDLRVSLVSDSEQMPKYFVIHIQDVTEITTSRMEAERATLAKSRFIANLSHEIRTPLNVIMGLVDMVKRSVTEKQQKNRLDTVTHAAETLLDMLNDILDFAKVESHEVSIKNNDIIVSELCENLKELIEPLANKKGLDVTFEVDDCVWPCLYGDKQKITQVMLNLLNNAVKYTQQGTVSFHLKLISTDNENQTIQFSVKDTGIGIKESDQIKLFDAFTQVDDSLSREHEGIGLGLAIVKHEVELLGGTIALNSQLGEGSEFYFSLALHKKQLAEQKKAKSCVYFGTTKPDLLKEFAICSVQKVDELPNNMHYLFVEKGFLSYLSPTFLSSIEGLEHIYVSSDESQIKNMHLTEMLTCNASFCEEGAFLQSCLSQVFFAKQKSSHFSEPLQSCGVSSSRSQHSYCGALCYVVDDNEINLEIAKNLLKQLGLNVVISKTAKDICNAVDKLRPDIIFMDIHMPEVDGFQAAKQLSDSYHLNEIPIFALTANAEISSQQEYLHSSMQGYINKPVSIEELEKILVKHVRPQRKFFDEAFALQQMMGESSFLDNMLVKFSELCSKYIEQLESDLEVKDMILLAHSVKGASAGLGFERLADAAKQLEANVKQAQKIVNPELVVELKTQLLKVQAFINERARGC
ncbi:PAS domain-containing hybrid sensor histidine kinase/response regulator [Pseudoalteromonas phenolica]|uniref:histidine kinase n=1 Tax=Pseudoalteromonas phenolica TaxID=161398 RepID=A0A0S2K3X0_9GAMM|nr:ATP-binding protein [Pseudoalteromonas phenolica]ALO42921.1 hypothetical protein PP2015_2429 [Pseudoalteromonas phenolica]MBE0355941.1 hypothetical protein [Pseudoalteromonas phenolica O-BC30]